MAIAFQSGLFGTNYVAASGLMPSRNRIRRVVLRPGFKVMRELLDTLIGATAGSAASHTYKRIAEDSGQGGGNRTIETVTSISRNSAAADVTALKLMLVNVTNRPTYVADLSGNGGPAFS